MPDVLVKIPDFIPVDIFRRFAKADVAPDANFTAADVVGIFDSTTSQQIFTNARAIKARVTEMAKVMEHPLANGATIVDHAVILPVQIELSVICSPDTYTDVYTSIKQYFVNKNLVTVQTKTGRYPNMLFNGIPHEEDPEMWNTIAMGLSLRQAQLIQPRFGTIPQGTAKNESNTSTVDTGQKQPKSAAIDLAQRAVSALRSFF